MNSTKRVVMNNFDSHIKISELETSNNIDHVPAQVYHARLTQGGDLVLVKERSAFEVPTVLYAPHPRYRDAIIREYDREGPALGVLLEGNKGSGKSLLAEDIANWALKQDLPVISVDVKLPVQMLRMIYNAVGSHVLLIDEFDKLYMNGGEDHEHDDAEALLNFFSDNSNRGLLTILTMNKNSPNLYADRPQRFNFRIKFGTKILPETIEQILKQYNVGKQFHEIIQFSIEHSSYWNVDCVKRLAKEAALCKDVGELVASLEILNTPSLMVAYPRDFYVLDSVAGEEVSEVRYQLSSNNLTVKLRDGTIEEHQFDSEQGTLKLNCGVTLVFAIRSIGVDRESEWSQNIRISHNREPYAALAREKELLEAGGVQPLPERLQFGNSMKGITAWKTPDLDALPTRQTGNRSSHL